MTKLSAALCAVALLTATASAQLKSTQLTGTWRITEVRTTGPNARTIKNPPGLLIFTGKYVSRMFVNSDQPRTGIRDPAKASASELLAVWGPFLAAAGPYQIMDDKLTVRALVAKNPQVMTPEDIAVYSFKLEGNTLVTTEVRRANRAVANPTTITYTRIE